MFPFLFFWTFFFSFCRICRDSIPLLVTVFSQAGYFSLACPSLSFGNLKKSQLLFRAVRGSIGVKNRPPGNGSGYNLVTTPPALSCLERVPPQRRVWRGHLKYSAGPGYMVHSSPSRRGRCPHRPEGSITGRHVCTYQSCPSGFGAMWASHPHRP